MDTVRQQVDKHLLSVEVDSEEQAVAGRADKGTGCVDYLARVKPRRKRREP